MAQFVNSNKAIDSETALKLTFKVGAIYYISAPELIETTDSHYFAVVAKTGSKGYLLVSTTQLHTLVKYFDHTGMDKDLISMVSPDDVNCLKKNSYFNCNKVLEVNDKYLLSKMNDGHLHPIGNLKKVDYVKLRDRIIRSPLVEKIIKKLLPEEHDY